MTRSGQPGPCGKRPYGSRRDARRANSHVHNRFRVYWCRPCNAFHITHQPFDPWRHND